ncbi:MAG: Cna B-type domain-containing protein, partial [Clostridia bacterium]|nr:Cna B-type domain-containing protein [Clostridia bacterium]
MRKLGSRALAMFLSIIMILSCMSAAFTVFASAADWKYVQGTTYEPVTIYKEVLQPQNGKTYRIAVWYYDLFLSVNSSGTVGKAIGTQPDTSKVYYTTNDGSDVKFDTSMIYSEDDLPNCDFIMQNGTLQHVPTKRYIYYSNSSSPSLATSSSYKTTFTYTVDTTKGIRQLSATIGNRTRYLALNNDTNRVISYTTSTNYAYVILLEKTTVYKKVASGEGGYYKYDGEKKFTVDQGSKFNDAYIRNQISVLHKADSSIPDAEADILDINSDDVTFSWNTPVDTSKIGTYTGTVYVNGQKLDTIELVVREAGESISAKADPSTSKIENQFSMTSADDGKMATDKTVRYEGDEYGAFGTYENDEFSIALSALGQSFPTVETVEAQSIKRNHPDVVFVIDASGSMRVYNLAGGEMCRGEATAKALNEAIKELYEQDPETRIGIVTFSNDYHEAGVFLPLDKYTLPEGQTDYITWDGRMVAKSTTPPVESTSNAIYSFNTARYFNPRTISSSTSAPQTYPYYYVDRNGQLSRTDQVYDYSQSKYVVTTTNLGTIADGKYIADGGAFAFYRKGSTIYIFDGSTFDGVGTSAPYKTYNNLDLQVKTTSAPQTITNIKSMTGWPGYSDAGFYKPDFSEITKIATVQNGVTYYAFNYYDDSLMIYSSEYPEWPVARMKPSPMDGGNYPGTYIDDYITITCINGGALRYTVNTYATKKGGNVYFEKNDYMMATNFLINSKGQTIMPSSYQFVGNQGTYTQSGLKAAENLFKEADNKENRVPSVVLISDGIPTIGSSNTTNPPLKYGDSGVSGYGLSTDEKFKDDLTNFGLWTIETAISVKNNVQNMYAANNGNKKALFYTIGPGVNYIMGQTVLDPTEENLDKAAAKTTYDDANAESGVGVPADLAKKVRAKYSNLDLVDYADWSYSGDMSGQDLTNAFKKVVTSLMEVNRPVVSTTEKTEIIGEVSEAMTFTDTIGDGMLLTGDPVVRYNNKNYSHTSKSEKTVDGLKVTTYKYNYQVTETSTNRRYDLNDLTVTVTENKDGTQTVKWFIPSELVPIIVYDYSQNQYISANPIRLVYKVGLTDEAKEEGGVFYTNSTEDKANVEFTPVVGNPYYYDNKKGSDGQMHSTLKTDLDKHTEKVDNITNTDPDSNHQTVDKNTGKITSELGNNGEIEIKYTTIEVTKVWADGNDAIGKRPDNIKVRVYKDGSAYGDVYTLTEKDAISKGKDANGEDIWAFQIKGLPYEEGSVYTINEISISGYDTEIVYKDGQPTITNSRPKAKIAYELYLVDKDGTPINDKGETVSFKDRTVKSELVEINQYLGSTGTIDLDEIEKLLPDGYYIYNPNSSFTEDYKGNEPSTGSKVTISDTTGTTKVFYPESAKTGANGTVTGITDYSDVKVAFAIAKIAINPDVIVVDYGKTILCSPLDNDNGNSVKIIGVGPVDGTTYSDSYVSQNGVFKVEGNNVIFSPFSYMSSINRVKYYVSTASTDEAYKQLNSTISVIPATTMYYEDNFGGSQANGGLYINYTGEWITTDGNGNTTAGVKANTDTNDRQDRGEVGQGHTPYGYDSSYDDCAQFSNGTASK